MAEEEKGTNTKAGSRDLSNLGSIPSIDKLGLCNDFPDTNPILIQAYHPHPKLPPDSSYLADKDTSTTALGTESKMLDTEKGQKPAIFDRMEYFRLILKIGEICMGGAVCWR